MIPLFPLLLAGGALLFVTQASRPHAHDSRLVELDASMPPPLAAEVRETLVHERDPAKLETYAIGLGLEYPHAAYELRYQAWILRGRQGPAPAYQPAPQPLPVPAPNVRDPGCEWLDTTIDNATCRAVLHALQVSTDPAELDAFATTIPQFPVAGSALRAKAALLRGAQPGPAPAPAPDPGTVEHNPPPPPVPPTPAPPKGVAPGTVAGTATGQSPVDIVGEDQGPKRQKTGWYVVIRASDKVFPPKLAKIGSGSEQNAEFVRLQGMNPHLIGPAQVLASFRPGDEVAVPEGWAKKLAERGFEVHRDEG